MRKVSITPREVATPMKCSGTTGMARNESSAAAVGSIINRVVTVEGIVTQIMHTQIDQTVFAGFPYQREV